MTARKFHKCELPGCDNGRVRQARFCSEQCRRDASAQRKVAKQTRRMIEDANRFAGRAEPCRACPGKWYCKDESGMAWCACARRLDVAA